MTNIEKVINGLEHCISEGDCRGCPYFKVILDSKIICPCREDALTLLKEQNERIKLLEHQLETLTRWRMNAGAFD